jgi:hypothetical protein
MCRHGRCGVPDQKEIFLQGRAGMNLPGMRAAAEDR